MGNGKMIIRLEPTAGLFRVARAGEGAAVMLRGEQVAREGRGAEALFRGRGGGGVRYGITAVSSCGEPTQD